MNRSSTSGDALTSLAAGRLAQLFHSGEVSAREIVEAHIARIESVDPSINAMVVRRFPQALAEADQLDQGRRQGDRAGMLAGVPISLKESVFLAGTESTIGLRRFAGEIVQSDGPLVTRLRNAGAIVLGKTNLPQLMLMHETDNPIYGRTNNPWDPDRSPGGSSGGEAAAIAAGETALGLASDVGGSIRQPSHSCGICGLKPTSSRLPTRGWRSNLPGMQAIPFQPGPMARKVEDLDLAMQVLVGLPGQQRADMGTPPVPWRPAREVDVSRLKIGYFTADGCFPPSPAVVRAVQEAAQSLSAAGAQIEKTAPPDPFEMLSLYLGLLSADGMAGFARLVAPGEADWRIGRMLRLGSLHPLLRQVAALSFRLLGQETTAWILRHSGPRSADGYRQLTAAMERFNEAFLTRMADAELDALLLPPHGLPALRHQSSAHLLTPASYCFLPNLLGTPAGVVPVTRVRPDEQVHREPCRDTTVRTAIEVERGSAGLPVGVQVIAPPWREDIVLAVMQAIEQQCAMRKEYPHTPVNPRPATEEAPHSPPASQGLR